MSIDELLHQVWYVATDHAISLYLNDPTKHLHHLIRACMRVSNSYSSMYVPERKQHEDYIYQLAS